MAHVGLLRLGMEEGSSLIILAFGEAMPNIVFIFFLVSGDSNLLRKHNE